MKKILFAVWGFFLLVAASWAQENPVKWKCSVKYLKGNEAELVIKANVGGGYHLYSQDAGGALPTTFNFPESGNFKLVGTASENPAPVEENDEFLGMVRFFAKDAEFRQKITIHTEEDFTIDATVDYQVCNDETCLPFNDIELSFKVKGVKGVAPAPVAEAEPVAKEAVAETSAPAQPAVSDQDANATVEEASAPAGEEESLAGFFLLAILAGLACVFTPCVFPMIPMTVSFFMDTDDGSSRKAGIIKGAIFTLSITLIYTLIGAIVAITKSADFANVLSTHWIPNLIFFLLFVTFAFSFFGLFEITLPSGMSNKLDAKADKGGYIRSGYRVFLLHRAFRGYLAGGSGHGDFGAEASSGHVLLRSGDGIPVLPLVPVPLFAGQDAQVRRLAELGQGGVRFRLAGFRHEVPAQYRSGLRIAYLYP